MDFDSIPPGVDFREQIRQMIERSNVVIAIIGPHWLGEQPDASRRIDNPADFVRVEIAHALKRGIPIIPVLVNNTPMPSSEKLPEEIKDLAFRNAVTLDTGIDFHNHADRLIAGIRKKVRGPTRVAASRKIFILSAAILLAVGASATWLLLGHRHEQESNAPRQPVGVESPSPAEAESSVSPAASAPTPMTLEDKIESDWQIESLRGFHLAFIDEFAVLGKRFNAAAFDAKVNEDDAKFQEPINDEKFTLRRPVLIDLKLQFDADAAYLRSKASRGKVTSALATEMKKNVNKFYDHALSRQN